MSRAGFPANRLYLDSRASISILFNDKLLNKIDKLPQAAHVKAGGSDIKLSKGGALHHNLAILLLPAEGYYYDEKALANLLSLACIVNEYWVSVLTMPSMFKAKLMAGQSDSNNVVIVTYTT